MRTLLWQWHTHTHVISMAIGSEIFALTGAEYDLCCDSRHGTSIQGRWLCCFSPDARVFNKVSPTILELILLTTNEFFGSKNLYLSTPPGFARGADLQDQLSGDYPGKCEGLGAVIYPYPPPWGQSAWLFYWLGPLFTFMIYCENSCLDRTQYIGKIFVRSIPKCTDDQDSRQNMIELVWAGSPFQKTLLVFGGL